MMTKLLHSHIDHYYCVLTHAVYSSTLVYDSNLRLLYA
jgi:hypothetical protein